MTGNRIFKLSDADERNPEKSLCGSQEFQNIATRLESKYTRPFFIILVRAIDVIDREIIIHFEIPDPGHLVLGNPGCWPEFEREWNRQARHHSLTTCSLPISPSYHCEDISTNPSLTTSSLTRLGVFVLRAVSTDHSALTTFHAAWKQLN